MSLLYFPSQAGGDSAGGAMTFISQTTLSADASLEYTISADYDSYQFELIDIQASATADIDFFMSSDGTNFTVPITGTQQYSENRSGTYSTYPDIVDPGPVDVTDGYPLFNLYALSGQGGRTGSSWIRFTNPNSASFYKKAYILCAVDTVYASVDRLMSFWMAASGQTTSAIQKVKFAPSTGTFNGTINVYGIKDS